jgi:mRNA-degrading endonuclease RelE of RelBE toxin-antitoxin system
MTHRKYKSFQKLFEALPIDIQELANKNYNLLKANPFHPSLHFKKVGNRNQFWSVRVGESYRALGLEVEENVIAWFWIGPHAGYDKIIS